MICSFIYPQTISRIYNFFIAFFPNMTYTYKRTEDPPKPLVHYITPY